MWNICWPRVLGRLLLVASILLWTGSQARALDKDTSLNRFGRQTWRTENGLPQNTVQAILQSRDGYIWLGTEGGLVRFDGVRFLTYDSQNTPALTNNNIRGLVEDRDGALWIGTADGIARLKNSEFTAFTTRDGLPGNDILSLYLDGGGRVSAVTTEGSARWENGRFEASANTNTPGSVVLTDRQETTWVGTDRGLIRIRNGKQDRFPAGDALSTGAILSLYEDREGDLWIGTESDGVTILRNQKFTTYTSEEDPSDDVVQCVFEDRSGVVWIGTNGHGLRRFVDGRFSNITTVDGLSSNVVFALAQDANGDLLVGTPDGLDRIHKGAVSVLTSADGLADDFVRSIFVDDDGSLWIGTRRGLSHYQQGRFTTYTQSDGLGSDLVGALSRDSRNDLWIGTLHGLSRLRNGKFTNYTTADGLSSNVITSIEGRDGELWIGTQGGGLNRYRNGRFVPFPANFGLPQTIYGISQQGSDLWMSSNAGIFRAGLFDLTMFAERRQKTINVVSYGTSDGLRISECSAGGHPAVWLGKEGELWFATLQGAAVTKVGANAQMSSILPPVVIESVSIDDQAFDPARLKDVKPGHSRFSFEYAGLSFIAPQKVRFKYKLEGFDRDWIDAGTRRVAYYTNIAPGNYRFRVMARNNDGVWNTSGASVGFRLEPRFYQTYWFDALILALLGLFGYSIYRWRVTEVEGRFRAVLQERNRIAREIHDTLAQGFIGVSVQLEIVSRLLESSVDSAREHLDQARVLVRSSLSEARRSIWELRSQSNGKEDLAIRLSRMASQAAASNGSVKVRFQVHGTYRPLGENIEEQLLKIGQEAVSNAIRHARAEHIDIDLAFEVKKLRMTVADDGCGFAAQPDCTGPNGHFGLKGIRERAEQIDAELTVNSAIGEGTSISVEATVN